MKVALVTDLHFGVRNDNVVFADYQKRFFEKDFWPVVLEQCDELICLGDTFDRRRFINYRSFNAAQEMFFDPIRKWGKRTHLIIGNHDTYYKKNNSLSSPTLLLRDMDDKVNIYNELPEEVEIGGVNTLMIPWIAPDNAVGAGEKIANSRATSVFGHLEVNGFPMHPGMLCSNGSDPKTYKRFEQVFSGHFHTKTSIGNIMYIGNAYQLTWADYGQERGFHIWDTETLNLEFFPCTQEMFVKIDYDDTNPMTPIPMNLKDKMVKVFVKKKENPTNYDVWITSLQDQDPMNLAVIEDFAELEVGEVEVESRDTMSILTDYVDKLDLGKGGNELNLLLSDLYQEAGQIKDVE